MRTTTKKIWHCTEENGGWVKKKQQPQNKGCRKKNKCLLSMCFVLGLLGMLWVGRCMAEPWILESFKPVSVYVLALNVPKAPKQCSTVRLELEQSKNWLDRDPLAWRAPITCNTLLFVEKERFFLLSFYGCCLLLDFVYKNLVIIYCLFKISVSL